MNCQIQFIPEAANDYKSLDGSIKKLVNDKIDKLRENPFLGEALGNKKFTKKEIDMFFYEKNINVRRGNLKDIFYLKVNEKLQMSY
jgi:hypothetical protein